MTSSRPSVTRLADPSRWTFGGYPYGIEPLVLPPSGAPTPDEPQPTPTELGHADTFLAHLDQTGSEHDPEVRQVDPETVAWFRWITGHQICFVLWRLLAEIEPATVTPTAEQAHLTQTYIRAYSAMLLYTGSCTRSTYQSCVRPTMERQHPSFSGSWAPDYFPVRALLRGRSRSLGATREVSDALDDNKHIHDLVADWLVPSGVSLLRKAEVGKVDSDLASMLFDGYFLTARQPVTTWEVAAQLLRRVAAVTHELSQRPLYSPDDQRSAQSDTWGDAHAVTSIITAATRAAFDSTMRRIGEPVTAGIRV